ncbi:hypothetical protein AQUCO_00600104v1 [Aquilegia coerulea]|uniref:Uncharacterized protein n=1 Tax=Aquilegia coerulea TaxID=218851 RepID=A0A2G5EMY7_AQUCA|nr:hypothetical protein AQUCO_00600104v1 [Aquilegia coerulea]
MRRKVVLCSAKLRWIEMVSCTGRGGLIRTDSRMNIDDILKMKLATIMEEDVERTTITLEKNKKKRNKSHRSANNIKHRQFILLTNSYMHFITRLASKARL